MDAPVLDASGIAHQLPSEMPDLAGDFNRTTGMPLLGSSDWISGILGSRIWNLRFSDAQFSNMDVPVSNDSSDVCENTGNGMKTGMRVRWNEDSSLLAGLDILMISVHFQLYGDFNSEFDWEELIFVAGSESPCKPAGTICTWKVPLEGTLFCCEFYTQKTDSGLCDQPVDLMNYFDILWDEGEKMILSVDFPGVTAPRGCIIWVYWRLPEFTLMQLSGVCFMQVNRCFSVWN